MLISIWTKKNIYIFFEQSHISSEISTRNWNTRFIAMIERLYIWKIFHLESFHHPDSATRKNVCFSVEISGGRNGWGRNGGNNVAESVSLVLWSTECNGTSIQLQRREKSLVLHALVSSPPPPPPPLFPPRPLLSCRTASFHPPTHGPERFSRWNQTPTIGSRCIERSMTSLNFPWRHATGSQLSFGNNRAVSLRVIDQAVGSLFDACSDSTHAMIYKLHRNETIESRWNRPIVLKRVYENGWAPFNEGINFTRWERCHWDY